MAQRRFCRFKDLLLDDSGFRLIAPYRRCRLTCSFTESGRMRPNVVLEWLKIAGWFAIDDHLRSAIIAKDALRHACRSGRGTGTDNRPAANSGNPDDAGPIPSRGSRMAPPTPPSQLRVSAFRLPGRGVF